MFKSIDAVAVGALCRTIVSESEVIYRMNILINLKRIKHINSPDEAEAQTCTFVGGDFEFRGGCVAVTLPDPVAETVADSVADTIISSYGGREWIEADREISETNFLCSYPYSKATNTVLRRHK